MNGDSNQEQGIIESLVDQLGKACWLGGNNLKGSWKWVSGETISLKDSRWDKGEPSGGNEHYLGIYGDSSQTSYATINKWNDFANGSNTIKGFVVEYTPAANPEKVGISIDKKNFPDDAFRQYVEQFDTNRDGGLNKTEIAAVTAIDVSGQDITNLKGLKNFTSLKELDCSSNPLDELVLSGNPALVSLTCQYTDQLSKLDVSKCPALKMLICTENALTALDVSHNTKLKVLDCDGNKLTTLDVSKCTDLQELNCGSMNSSASGNNLTKLKLGNLKKLKDLSCLRNPLKELDISGCTLLTAMVQNSKRQNEDFYDYWDKDGCRLKVDSDDTVILGNLVSNPKDSYPKQKALVTVQGGVYELNSKKTAAVFVRPAKKSVKTLVIQDKVQIGGKTYKVTEIKAGACEGLKKLTKLTVGKYIKTIGSKAFYKNGKLKTIIFLGTAVKKVESNAFGSGHSKPTVTCPKSKVKAYSKLLTKAKLSKKAIFKKSR